MTATRMTLTDKAVQRLPPASEGQYVVRDADLAGFYLLVGKRRRTYMVQGSLRQNGKGISVKISVGHASDLTATKARAIAKSYLGELGQGRRPKEAARNAGAAAVGPPSTGGPAGSLTDASPVITLRTAWDRYLTSHLVRKNRSEATIAGYRDHVERLLKDWLDIPLKDLADDADRVARKHDDITKESGPYIANGSMRTLRAIYNHAWAKNRGVLPRENPVDAVDWNPEHRRNTAMGLRDLPGWFAELAAMENPIRREFHLFTLLSGSRPSGLKQARLEHLDLRRRVLHISNPKGGSKRAFDIPLSRQMIACLMRVIRFGRFLHPVEAGTWLFPASSAVGHMVECKEDREDLSKWGNDLRQSFRTLATIARVSELDAKMLMNHAFSGVNEGYITRDKLLEDHLRERQQAISDLMFSPIREETLKPCALKAWLEPRATRRVIERAVVERLAEA